MLRLIMLDDYQGAALSFADWDRVRDTVEIEVVREHLAGDALVQRLAGAEIVVAMRERTPFDRALLSQLPDLKLLVTTGPRNLMIDFEAAREAGIVVCGTRGSGTATVDLVWGLILSTMRNIPREDAAVRRGAWQETIGFELGGRTLGIVGLGSIGSRVARIAHAFEMSVIAWSENLTQERADEAGATLVTKEELFATADVVTIHLVLSERSRGLIGSREIGLMKPTARLINTSRGPIVDEAALVAALETGAIAAAGLDVFDREPLPPDHPLRHLTNTVITPHIGYVGHEAYSVFYADALEDVEAFLAGSPIRILGQADGTSA